MDIPTQCRKSSGELADVPADYETIHAVACDGYLVLSSDDSQYMVRYGLSTKSWTDIGGAIIWFSQCHHHYIMK